MSEHELMAVALGPPRGGKKPQVEIEWSVVRALDQDDLVKMASGDLPAVQGGGVLKIRHSHHLLAQALATGRTQAEVSLLTGYSPSYISIIKEDPAFAELLAYYAGNREKAFVDVLDRMKSLGLSSLDELQARLADDPDGWSKRELMDLSELMLVKGRGGALPDGIGMKGPAGVSVTVNFVQSPNADLPAELPIIGTTLAGQDGQ